MRIRIISILLIMCPVLASAQTVLTLDEAIAQAQEKSLLSQQAEHNYQAEEFDYQEWRAGLKPQFWLKSNPQYEHTSGTNLYQVDGQVEMTQIIERWGGTVYANTGVELDGYVGSYADLMKASGNSKNQWLTMPFQVGYKQDLIGYNSYKWDRRIQEFHNKEIRAEHAYELAQIAETATEYFFAYLSAQTLYDMYQKNALTADTLYEIGKEKYAITSIRKDELISLELQLLNMKNSLRSAEKNRDMARETLISYLNLSDSITDLEVILPQQPKEILIDQEDAIKYALTYNPDYLSQKENILSQEQSVDKTKKESGFQASVDVSVGRRNQSANFWTSFDMRQPYTLASVSMAVPLYDHGAARNRKKAAESRLKLQEVTLDETARQLREEVVNTLKEFNNEQTHLAETQRAIELADQSYQQNQYNYAHGMIDISTFTLAQDRKDDATNNYIESLQSYWESFYKLRRLTMYDFLNNRALF